MTEQIASGDEIIWNDPIGHKHRGIVIECSILTFYLVVDEIDMVTCEKITQVKIPRNWVESTITDVSKKRSTIEDYDRAMSIL